MTFARFVAQVLGVRVTAPGGIGGQCVDLCNLYLLEVLGVPAVHANAVDWASLHVPGCVWVPNGPDNYPAPGGIVVWGPSAGVGTGINGHVALSVLADGLNLLSLDCNWPDGSPCRLVSHSYTGVRGWHLPMARG